MKDENQLPKTDWWKYGFILFIISVGASITGVMIFTDDPSITFVGSIGLFAMVVFLVIASWCL